MTAVHENTCSIYESAARPLEQTTGEALEGTIEVYVFKFRTETVESVFHFERIYFCFVLKL